MDPISVVYAFGSIGVLLSKFMCQSWYELSCMCLGLVALDDGALPPQDQQHCSSYHCLNQSCHCCHGGSRRSCHRCCEWHHHCHHVSVCCHIHHQGHHRGFVVRVAIVACVINISCHRDCFCSKRHCLFLSCGPLLCTPSNRLLLS